MRIGDLAASAGVSVRSLRYYEQRDLLASERTAGNQREYGEDAVDRVRLIVRLIGSGLSSAAIAQLLPCAYSGRTTPGMITIVERELAAMDDRIEQLRGTRDRLGVVLTEARGRLAA